MSNDRIIQGALILAIAGAMVAWFGVVPLHARAASQQAETTALLARVAQSPVPSERLTPFRAELDRRSKSHKAHSDTLHEPVYRHSKTENVYKSESVII